MEGWKVGRLEGWKAGRLEGWKVRRLEGSKVRRPGPSDDYYDDFDENGYYPPVSPVSMCQHDDDEYEEGVEYDDDEGFNGDDGDEHQL